MNVLSCSVPTIFIKSSNQFHSEIFRPGAAIMLLLICLNCFHSRIRIRINFVQLFFPGDFFRLYVDVLVFVEFRILLYAFSFLPRAQLDKFAGSLSAKPSEDNLRKAKYPSRPEKPVKTKIAICDNDAYRRSLSRVCGFCD